VGAVVLIVVVIVAVVVVLVCTVVDFQGARGTLGTQHTQLNNQSMGVAGTPTNETGISKLRAPSLGGVGGKVVTVQVGKQNQCDMTGNGGRSWRGGVEGGREVGWLARPSTNKSRQP
jgi:hypothetical protein